MLANTKRPSSGPHISTNITNGILLTFPCPPLTPSICLTVIVCQMVVTCRSASRGTCRTMKFTKYQREKGACFKPKLVRTFSASSQAFSDVQGTTFWLHLMVRMTKLVRTFSASSQAFSDVQGTTFWLHLIVRMTR